MKCRDPCPGSCGTNAICQVVNHLPICSCITGYSGNPFTFCHFVPRKIYIVIYISLYYIYEIIKIYFRIVFSFFQICIINLLLFITAPVEPNPCVPSPCGPNSQCRSVNGKASCVCLPPNVEGPNGCRPECVISSECPINRACLNQKCIDPCPGTCGIEAQCETLNHNPICSCLPNYTGDPFVRCFKELCKFFHGHELS